MKNIVSVDPGIKGGIATFSGAIELHNMPDSLHGMRELLAQFKNADAELWIEEVPRFCGKNIPSSTTSVLFQNFGRIEGLAVALGYSLHRVPPKQWQETLGLGGRKSCNSQAEWKRKLKSKAEELYPALHVTLSTADALLILRHAMATTKHY